MKTLITKFVIAITLILCLPLIGSASIVATSDLTISDFLITKAGGGGITVGPGGDITVSSTADSYFLRANVNGFEDFNANMTPGAGNPPSLIDGLAAGSDGTGTYNSTGVLNNFGIENMFALPGSEPFAMADSSGSGNILFGGAAVRSFSGVQATNVPLVGDTGTGVSSLLSESTIFENTSGSNLIIEFSFDALLKIVLDNGVPPGFLTGAASFFVEISGLVPGLDVLSIGGGPFVDSFIFDPLALNPGVLTAGSDVSLDTGLLSFMSPTIEILDGALVSFEIFQGTSASLSPIPEPTTLAVWGILGFCIASTSSRRRRAS